MNKKALKNEIKKTIDIADGIGYYLQLTKKGSNFWAVCPFHQDTKPSLSISNKLQIFNCFTCRHSGDLIKFVQDYKQISEINAIKEIVNEFNLDKKILNKIEEISPQEQQKFRLYELNNLSSFWYCEFLKNNENKFALDYLYNRGLDDEIIRVFKIGYAPNKKDIIYKMATNQNNLRQLSSDKNDLIFSFNELTAAKLINVSQNGEIFDFFNDRIIFSIEDENENIIGFSGRTIKDVTPKYLNTAANEIFKKEITLYNIANAIKYQNDKTLYIVEGFMDVIALYKIGIKNVVATMGVAFSLHHLNKILENMDIETIILAFDNDAAGESAKLKVAKEIGDKINVFILKKWQYSEKDFDELVNKYDLDTVLTVLSNTEDLAQFLLETEFAHFNPNNKALVPAAIKKALEIVKKYGNQFYLNAYKAYINQKVDLTYDFGSLILKPKKLLLKNLQPNYDEKDFDHLIINKKDKKTKTSDYEKYKFRKDGFIFKIICWIFWNKNYLDVLIQHNIFLKPENKELMDLYSTVLNFYDCNSELVSLHGLSFDYIVDYVEHNGLPNYVLKHLQKVYQDKFEFNKTSCIPKKRDFINLIYRYLENDIRIKLEKLREDFKDSVLDESYQLRKKILVSHLDKVIKKIKN